VDDPDEGHACPVRVLQILVEHGFDFRGTISTQIELEVH
jgi:hypothetical protein